VIKEDKKAEEEEEKARQRKRYKENELRNQGS
jgi:hypothetical protein